MLKLEYYMYITNYCLIIGNNINITYIQLNQIHFEDLML